MANIVHIEMFPLTMCVCVYVCLCVCSYNLVAGGKATIASNRDSIKEESKYNCLVCNQTTSAIYKLFGDDGDNGVEI